jgi:hypothetical protein
MVTSPGSDLTKVQALIDRAAAVVADVASVTSRREFESALARLGPRRVIVVYEGATDRVPPFDSTDRDRPVSLSRPPETIGAPEPFVEQLAEALRALGIADHVGEGSTSRPEILIEQGHYGLALVAAYAELEAVLREESGADERYWGRRGSPSVMVLLREAADAGRADRGDVALLADYWGVRNQVAHGLGDEISLSKARAKNVVAAARRVIEQLRGTSR